MSDQEWPSSSGDGASTGGDQPSSAPPPAAPTGGSSTPPPPPPGSPPPAPSSPPAPGGAPATAGMASAPGLGMRFLARLIDGLIVAIPLAIVLAIIPGVSTGGLVGQFIVSVAGFAYFVYLESSSGATIGKRLLNMQVVSSSGGHLSMEASARRNWWVLIGALSGIPVLGVLIGLASLAIVIYIAVTISSDPANRGWHDKLADAGVVPA